MAIVEEMAASESEMIALLEALNALKNGDFSTRLPLNWTGLPGKLADAFNEVVSLDEKLVRECERLSWAIGKEGKLSQRGSLNGAEGKWQSCIGSINNLIDDLVHPTSETARVIGAVAQGDLSQTMAIEVEDRPLKGEFLHTAKTINKMVSQLSSFAAEVTRVAREVGTDGKLGGQAKVAGVGGTWKDLTESVNSMASNLTSQMRNIAEVTTAVARGDLSKKIAVDVKGEFLELKNTINTMVDQLRSFASEVTRVAREVGTEGKLGGQAKVEGASGTWKDLTDSVNSMAGNLTDQVRNIAQVTTAVATGDLSKKITVDVKGEILELKDTINTMVDQLRSFAAEVTRVAREVGTEGKLGGQADVQGVAGTWKDLTDSVNSMASNLTVQLRDVSKVATAIASGDLTQKITVNVSGEILQIKNVINTMVDQLGSFGSEVTRVAREVGTEGKLGGQADVQGVAGTWKDLTDSVNSMASNLTSQVRNIADVTKAVATGDLSKKITVDVKGEILELKNTVNTMVDQLSSFASEVTRVAREVGTEGSLGGQANVKDVAGTWKDLTDSVNSMASNLTSQVRNIADVTKAVANGDLSKKITVDVKGEILELKDTINTMVDQLRSFAAEVTRVAREVGTEGKLGGQADVKGVAGTWKDLTDSVNSMASNLTSQVRNIAEVTTAVATGDLSKKITVDVKGEILELKDTINTMVDQLRSFGAEVTRVAREVGTEGKLGGQAEVQGVAGTWKDLTDSVNFMASNLTSQVRNIAEVTKAVAAGDLSRTITVDVKGEILELKNTINTMVDQLNSFASEVTRMAREVGTEGMLGGQAQVQGVAGIWKDLTDSVNSMAGNLTAQVRGIAKVVTAVANGNLHLKLTVEAKGEIAALSDTINGMIDTLAIFADQVTSVAREVGVEGKLGGQAKVPGASGTWKMLTENVNQLAANLTTQVRAIAEVAMAVTKGDLTRSITVEALGEVAALKDTINEMIRNLKDTTQKNTEQDWLKTNLAKFSRMLQGQRDLTTVGRLILSELAPVVAAQRAEFYIFDRSADHTHLTLLASYAAEGQNDLGKHINLGEGLIGQCAIEKQKVLLENPPRDYIRISSGLGNAAPNTVIVLPVIFEGQVKGVLELASFDQFNPTHQAFLDQLTESIGIVLNTIEANMRTEGLLKQSQSLAQELQSRQEELQQTNHELQDKARLLVEQNEEVERKNSEVEQARQALEEKAKQLALTSKYKSEFLANMSHELRTPLNSLLILSEQLSKNPESNLTPRQTEFAKTIHSSGNDLLMLINDILDLSKIESGTVVVDVNELRMDDFARYVERTFRHVAESKGVGFHLHFSSHLPESIHTDAKRLQQVIKNLLSNAFKFTHRGEVSLVVAPVEEGWNLDNQSLNTVDMVIGFSVEDTGIGISLEKQQIIFEAFQQADGSTNRKYGGTGLGLAISRELAALLGGEIRLASQPGKGSTFTLFIPQTISPQRKAKRLSLSGSESLMDSAGISSSQQMAELNRILESGNVNGTTTAEPVSVLLTNEVGDDRDNIHGDDLVILIVENDLQFARLLLDMVREKGFKGLVTSLGAAALALTNEFKPHAITLDIHLPDIEGWKVVDRLKNDLSNRHIPVCIISTDDARERALEGGALAFVAKPIQKRETLESLLNQLQDYLLTTDKRLLLVDEDRSHWEGIQKQITSCDIHLDYANDISSAIDFLQSHRVNCLVLSSRIAQSGLGQLFEYFEARECSWTPSVIIYGDVEDEQSFGGLFQLRSLCTVRLAHSVPRLLEQSIILLHSKWDELDTSLKETLLTQVQSRSILADKRILIVDDDMRNIFAISSILEEYEMEVLSAGTGKHAIEILRTEENIDAVLMDIMMPEMDGYETMREIRKIPELKSLPIVAVTAKAMKGDRERCIEAGAWDYLPKPVDPVQLIDVLRGWLS